MPIIWITQTKWTNSWKDKPIKIQPLEPENMTRFLTSKNIELVIKNIPRTQQKNPGCESFTSKFFQIFKEEITPILLKLYQKSKEEGTHPHTFCEACINLKPKPNNDKIKLQANTPYENWCKTLQQNLSKPNSAAY